MQQLPLALRRYLWALNLCCLAVVLFTAVPLVVQGTLLQLSPALLEATGIFIVLTFTGHRVVLQVNRSVSQNLATPMQIAAILLFPPPLAIVITLVSSLASEALRRGSPFHKRAFNVAHPTLMVGLSIGLCSLVVSPAHLLQPERLAGALPGLSLLVAVFYAVDVMLMLGVLALLQRRSPWHIWWHDYRHALLPELAGSSIGIVGAILWHFDALAVALVILPVVALRVAFAAIAQAEEQSQALRWRSEQLEVVLTAGQQLRLQHTQADLLQPLAEAARTIAGASVATGYLLDEEDHTLLKRVVLVPTDAILAGPAQLPILPSRSNMHELFIDGGGTMLPLLLEAEDGHAAGLLLLGGDAMKLGNEERHTLAILATQAGIALQNAQLHERALAQASEDGLTGLLNHRAFQTRLEAEVARAQRTARPLALLMIDMDDFGTVNNTYGHQAGDATLAAVAHLLYQTIRVDDVAARYGGDEFVAILPETALEGALALAERIKGAIEALVVRDGELQITLRACIGVAVYPTHACSREELIRAGDQAAYAAKHAGKGRVGVPEDAAFTLDRDPAALTAQLEHANLATVAALAAAVDAKDPYTRGHSQRVSAYATALAKALQLSAADTSRITLAGLLHDVGKIGIPDAILTKPTRLNAEEYTVIMQHAIIGERMLSAVPFLRDILPAVRHHHERWDGTGYPDHLCAEQIPLDAAILMVADSLDAMTSSRTYRPALPLSEAVRRIVEGAGTQFHPRVVEAFERLVDSDRLVLIPAQVPGTRYSYGTERPGTSGRLEISSTLVPAAAPVTRSA